MTERVYVLPVCPACGEHDERGLDMFGEGVCPNHGTFEPVELEARAEFEPVPWEIHRLPTGQRVIRAKRTAAT